MSISFGSVWSALRRIAASAAIGLLAWAMPASANELNVLAWCDHLDAALIDPFAKANNVKVNVKDYEGTGTALTIIELSQPGDWDVFIVDSTDLKRVAGMGLLAELNSADYPWADIPEQIKDPSLHTIDGKLYGVPEKFGYNTVSFNNEKVAIDDMRDATILWSDKYKGRFAVYDYYLQIIAQVAIGLGKKPNDLTEADLPAVREKLLQIKANAALVGNIVTIQQALATGEVDLIVGGGEFVTAGLAKDNPKMDWVLHKQGGLRWQQAISVFAASGRKELATKFIQHVLSPEGQAALATSACFWGMPANQKATLTDEQKKILRWDEQPTFIAAAVPYPQLTQEFDKKLQDLWTEFLQK